MVDELLIELHPALKMSSPADLVRWADMFDLLFRREGFRLWHCTFRTSFFVTSVLHLSHYDARLRLLIAL